jgi:hypothetical protein
MDDIFEKYPSIEIVADGMDPIYKVRVMECVRDGGLVRFEKRELRIERRRLESFVAELLGAAERHGR